MDDPDPMEGGRTVHLCLHPAQVDYLGTSLNHFVAGLEDDIASRPDDPDVERWKTERDTYWRLAEGLEEQVVAVDGQTARLIREWAAANDLSEEFHRILFEHQALASLREQIEVGL
jgi:hypothetical protein